MNRSSSASDREPGTDLTREFAELARALHAEVGRLGTLQTVCDLAVTFMNVDHASVSVLRGSNCRTIAASDDLPGMIDQIQVETGEGPALDVASEREPIVSGDLDESTLWPTFARRVVDETGVRSMLCHRLFVRDGSLGVLTVHADRPVVFSAGDLVISGIFAAHAAIAVQAAEEQERANNLEIALRSSRRIGTAIGIVMHSHRVDEHVAFTLLREQSQRFNRKLHEVAEDVVYTGALGPPTRTREV